MRCIDSTTLLLLFNPNIPVPKGEDGKPISAAKERVEHLVQTLQDESARIIVPTPVLSEVLIRATPEQFRKITDTLEKEAVFRIEPFDLRAAFELAQMARADPGGKLDGRNPNVTYAKLKFDRQVIAIAKVNGATTIYSDDGNLKTVAERVGIKAVGLRDLQVPPARQQIDAFEEAHRPQIAPSA